MTGNLASKTDQELIEIENEKEFERLRKDIYDLGKREFSVLREELDKLLKEVERMKSTLRDDVSRAHGGVRLDINLEKARIKDESVKIFFSL